MPKLLWLDHLPDGSLQGAVDLANRLYWNVTLQEHEARWIVYAGEKPVYESDAREGAEAFIYGLGLAYAVLPEDTFDRLEFWVRRWVAPEDITPEDRKRFGGLEPDKT